MVLKRGEGASYQGLSFYFSNIGEGVKTSKFWRDMIFGTAPDLNVIVAKIDLLCLKDVDIFPS